MSHQIKLENLQNWLNKDQLTLYANSTKDEKSLYATLGGSFEVHFKGEVVHRTMQPYDAVEKYNSL